MSQQELNMEPFIAIAVLAIFTIAMLYVGVTFAWGIVLIMVRQVSVAWNGGRVVYVPVERVTDDMIVPKDS